MKSRIAFKLLSTAALSLVCSIQASAQIVNLNIGTLPAGSSVEIIFDVTVDPNIPSNVLQVSTQGIISGSNFMQIVTDDPDTAAPDDPTITGITQPPIAMCQDVMVTADASCMAVVPSASIDNGSFDPDGGMVTLSLDPPGPYTVGMTSVILSVTDDELDSATCAATITVLDNIPPQLSCMDAAVALDASGQAMIVAADVLLSVSDNCGVMSLSVTPDTFSCADLGPNLVTLTAEDTSGNSATCTATVMVMDVSGPSLVCPTLPFVIADATGQANIPAVTETVLATDNCTSATFLLITQNPIAGTVVGLGMTDIVVSATDISGNVSMCTSTLLVLDTTPTATPTMTPGGPTETPTPTITPGGPTLTSTPSITPGGPTLTPTSTITPGGPTFTPTSTITPGGPTLTFTPTITPGGPTLTPTHTPSPTETSQQVACDSGYYLLDSLGGRHRVGNPVTIVGPVYFGNDIARDLEMATCSIGPASDLVVLDGFGAAHFVANSGCDISQDFYFADEADQFPQGRAVDLQMTADSAGFWVLTDYGEIFRAGSAGTTAVGVGQIGVLGFDVPTMRDPGTINLTPNGTSLRAVSFVAIDEDANSVADGYLLLDSMGGRFHYLPDGSPVSAGTSAGLVGNEPLRLLDPTGYVWPFFPGLDIARDIELHPTQQGVVILDGWDGIHPVPVDIQSNPVWFARNEDPLGGPAQTVGMPYIVLGFDDPTTDMPGEDEGDPDLFGLDAESVFVDLEFSAGCPDSGLYTLDKFGGVFVLGDARPNPNEPVPGFGSSPYFFPFLYAEALEIFGRDET